MSEFKNDLIKEFKRLQKKYKLTTLEAISESLTEISFLVETAPDKDLEKQIIEDEIKNKIEKDKQCKAKWRSKNRDKLALYAKDYRIEYCGQKKQHESY